MANTSFKISKKKFVPMYFCVFLAFLLSELHDANANLPLCPFYDETTISTPCRFSPGVHVFTSLDINSDVFLETTSSAATQSFQVIREFTLRKWAVLAMGYNQKPNSGAGHGSSGGSYGGRGGTDSARNLNIHQRLPYGSSLNISHAGSQGGNGGKGGGLLKIQALNATIDGVIRVNGEQGEADRKSGGGSGGGIAIECEKLFGAGTMEVIGGLGRNLGGGGSGGRISVACINDGFSGKFLSQGGKTGI